MNYNVYVDPQTGTAKIAMTPELEKVIWDKTRELVAKELLKEAKDYLEQSRSAMALRRIQKAQKLGLDPYDYHECMADYYELESNSAKSIHHNKCCIRLSRQRENYRQAALSHHLVSKLYSELDNKKQAKYHAMQAYKHYKKDTDQNHDWVLYNNIAVQLRHTGHKELGLSIYKEIYDQCQDTIVRGNLFGALISGKHYTAAIELTIDIPIEQLPDYKDGLEIAYRATGNDALLKRHYRRMQEFYKREMRDAFNDFAEKKPTDPEISINGLTIDLKQLDDGSIRILEMNFLPASGLNGYNPHYKYSLQQRVNAGYQFLAQTLAKSGHYDPKKDNYLRYHDTGMSSPITFSNWMVMTHTDRPVLFNASLNALMAQHYKDEFALSVQGLGLHGFIPETIVASRYQSSETILQLAEKIQSDKMIIKTSNDARGEGVEVIPSRQLPRVIDSILNGGAWHECTNPQAWREDFHPNFLIQECVSSKPCRANNGLLYDGTMRVALTHVFDHASGQQRLLIHGMFWKLPQRPLSQGSARSQIVSLAKNSDIIRGNPHSARVAPSRQAQVQKQLEEFFQTYGGHMAMKNQDVIYTKKHYTQHHKNSPEALLATEQLTSHPYGNLISLLDKDNPHAMRSVFDFAGRINNHHMEQVKKAYLRILHGVPMTDIREARMTYSRSHNITP